MFKAYLSLLSGYIGWGLFPLYWQLLASVSPVEVTLHRIIWSVPVLALLIHLSSRRHRDFTNTLRTRRELKFLLLTAVLITVNWGIYVWAVANARVIEASMGYFLAPLIHISSGVLVFNEKLTPLKWLAVALAALGVCFYIISQGVFPWAGLGVGFSFAAYGVLRKKIATGAVVGLYVETLMMAPIALIGLFIMHYQQSASFLNSTPATDWWLILGGLVTVVPLALFTIGTRQLPMASVGILFFITPSMQFVMGSMVLGEPINTGKLIAFSIIWSGLILYSISIVRGTKHAAEN
jgi:chloramphenicol-sensitive protein RarD